MVVGIKLVVVVNISVVVVVGIKLDVVVVILSVVAVAMRAAEEEEEEALGLTGPSQTPALVHALTQSSELIQHAPLYPSPLLRPELPAVQVPEEEVG